MTNIMDDNRPTIGQIEDSSALSKAIYYGFDCAHCNKRKPIGFTPIRNNNNGPFFCSFYCGWKYAAARGDERAKGIVERLDNLSKYANKDTEY